jgi:hypothetical protein
MLGQKLDQKNSWWLFGCLVGGLVLSPMIVGGAAKEGAMKWLVVASVLFAAGIVGALAKERTMALCSAMLLTWPAFGHAILMTLFRNMSPVGNETEPSAPILLFAGVLMLLAPAITFLTSRFAGSPSAA